MIDPVKLRWWIVGVVLAVVVISRAASAQTATHWSELPNAQLEECDDIAALGAYEEATYCAARYLAAAAGTWTDSADPQFAEALPVLGLLGAAGLGFSIGSGVYRR